MAKKKVNAEEPIEKQLWKAADKLRKNIDAAEYKHIVLGLIFLKYISDSFEELHAKLTAGEGEYEGLYMIRTVSGATKRALGDVLTGPTSHEQCSQVLAF